MIGDTIGTVWRSWRELSSKYRAIFLLEVIIPVGILVLAIVQPWSLSPNSCPPHTTCPDATTLISTLIVVYTFFIAAYGALVAALIGRHCSQWLKVPALVYMIVAVVLDLVRKIGRASCRERV